jgi:hypothetical protein
MTEPGAVGTSRTETFGGKIARAFDEGMEGIVGLIAGLITLLMVLLPLAVLVGLLWWAYRSWRRKHPVEKGIPPQRPVQEQASEK